jgi:Rne/Rng family ribonuclease
MKTVLVNVEDRELRIAILENNQLTELYIEPLDDKTILNNVYKGRVEGVLPGLSAAFVNIGFERNAFLHFDDVRPDLLLELQAKREGRELPPQPELAAAPVSEAEVQESYVPTPEELEVVSQLVSEDEAEPVVEAPQIHEAMAQEALQSPRKRRRGRRGGRNRRKRWSDLQQRETHTYAPPQANLSEPVAAVEASGELPEPVAESAPSISAEEPAASPQPQQAQIPQHEARQGGGQRRKSRNKHAPSRVAVPPPPPPDAIRGTRAALVYQEMYAAPTPKPPKKQKKDRKRGRKQQATQPAQSWYTNPTPPPLDEPFDDDSQVAIFGHYEPPAPPSWDEPVEDEMDAQNVGGREESGNSSADSAEANANSTSDQEGARRPRSRRRSMRRKTSAPYAVRKRATAKADQEAESDAATDAAPKAKPKRTRSRSKKIAAEDLPEETSPVTSAGTAEQEPASEAPESKRRRASRTSKKQVDQIPESPEVAQQETEKAPSESAPVEGAAGTRKTSSRRRTRKTQEPEAEVNEQATSVAAAETPATSESETSAKPAKRTRRKKAQPDVASESSPAIVVETPAASESPAELLPSGAEQEVVAEPSTSQSASGTSDSVAVGGVAAAPSDTRSTFDVAEKEFVETEATSSAEVLTQEAPSSTSTEPISAGTTPDVSQEPLAMVPPQQPDQAAEGASAITAAPEVSAAETELPAAHARPHHPAAAHPHLRFARRHLPKVHEVLRKGDEILVQVTKEEIGGKGARISTYISLPGRYLVLLPYGNNEGGVSRRVEKFEERRRLKKLQRKLRHDLGIEHMGLIIRTAGMEKTEYELRKDAEFLINEWKAVQERAARSTAPALVYDDSDILYRLCRDVFDESIEKIVVDNAECAEKIRSILQNMIPELASRVELYQEPVNLFAYYGVDEKIRKAGRRRVWLKSGGYIIIDEAEALTAIDVNTGKFVGKDNQEQMILKTNLEAAQVIARELKLRDIGGIIVIDFIDMRDPRNREKLLEEFRSLLRKDHAKTSVSDISEFGLVEMTRKRVRQSLRKTLFKDCPYCRGAGIVFTEQEVWIHLKNAVIETLEKNYPRPDLLIHVNPLLKEFIDNSCAEAVQRIEQRYGVRISFVSSELMHTENFKIEKKQREGSVLEALLEPPVTGSLSTGE